MQNAITNKCLVLGSDPRIALAISRCLSKHSIVVEVAIPHSVTLASRFIGHVHHIESLNEAEAVVQQLTVLFSGEKIVLLPTNDLALEICSRFRENLEAHFILGIPRQLSAVDSVLDKEITLGIAQKLGVPVPQSFCSNDLSVIAAKLSCPMIAKPRTKSVRSVEKVHYIRTLEDLQQTKQILSDPTEHYIFQEFVTGIGVGIELLMHQGSSLVAFQHERIEELPCTGGVSVLAKAVNLNTDLVKQSVKLLRQLDWEGVAMVEYRFNPATGEAVLMEINGRYWGSLGLSLEAGLEFAYYHWQLLTGSSPNIPSSYRKDAKIAWTAGRAERLVHYISNRPQSWLYDSSVAKEFFKFVRDLPPFTPDAVWRLNDPAAMASEFRHALSKFAGVVPVKLRKFLKLNIRAKVEYIKLFVLAQLKRPVQSEHITQIKNILFICHGNIIRSAFAEQLARDKGVNATSAGTNAKAMRANPTAVNIAGNEFCVVLDQHTPKKVTQMMIEQADLVFAMDYFNLANLKSSFSKIDEHIFLMDDFLAGRYSIDHEVKDPFGGSNDGFVASFGKISSSIEKLVNLAVDRSDL